MKEYYDHKDIFPKSRQMIYEAIVLLPGIHLRKISRMLNISKSTVSYHLQWLEQEGHIFYKSHGKSHHYYSSLVGSNEATIISFLRKTTSRLILLSLLIKSPSSQINISKSIGKHPTTVAFYLNKLIDKDIARSKSICDGTRDKFNEKTTVNCGNGCQNILVHPNLIYNLVKKHKDDLLIDDLSKNMFCHAELIFETDELSQNISKGYSSS